MYPTPLSSLIKITKLLVGAAAFLGLCGALIFTFIPVAQIIENKREPATFFMLVTGLLAILATSILLYLAARKSRAERLALEGNVIAMKFARQKLILQVSSVALFLGAILIAIGVSTTLRHYEIHEALPSWINTIFPWIALYGYVVLGRKLWRCPACGHEIPFMRRLDPRVRQSIKHCPNCNVQLQ